MKASLLSFSGLTALAVGSAMWLFPALPAVTTAGTRPHFAWPPSLGLGIAIAGLAILTLRPKSVE